MAAAREFNQTLQLYAAAIQAVEPSGTLPQNILVDNDAVTVAGNRYEIKNGRLFLVSIGKASLKMASVAAQLLGDYLYKGIAVTKGSAVVHDELPLIEVTCGGHPLPDQSSVNATRQVEKLLQETTAQDLVIFLISGGSSALLTQPSIDINSWRQLNQALLASGCTINEFNSVRSCLDAVKAGGLARWAAPARSVSLIMSDVVGNNLAAIGSGPTFYSEARPDEALEILNRYQIEARLQTAVWQTIQNELGAPIRRREDGPDSAKAFAIPHKIIGDVKMAAQASLKEAQNLGYEASILTTQYEGEARELGKFVAAIAKDSARGSCLILGGEATVTLRGNGVGGRNLETALSAAIALQSWPHITIACLATDGDDGPTQKAGAVVNGATVMHGRELGLNAPAALENNDSLTYFEALSHQTGAATAIQTGLTGINVNDLIFILKHKEKL